MITSTKRRKSQVQTIFLVFLAAIIIILIFIFSFKSINTLKIKSSEIMDLALIQKLSSDISRIKNQAGKVESLELNVPDGVNYACFVDWSAKSFPPVPVDQKEIIFFLDVEEKQDENLRNNFILVGNGQYYFKRFEDFSLDSKVVCKNIEGSSLKVSIEGLGSEVRIT